MQIYSPAVVVKYQTEQFSVNTIFHIWFRPKTVIKKISMLFGDVTLGRSTFFEKK